MAVYKRQLSKGLRYWYKFSFDSRLYYSKTIYLTYNDARKAEAKRLKEVEKEASNPDRDMPFFELAENRLLYIKGRHSKFYYTENNRYLNKARKVWRDDTPVSRITKAMVNRLLMEEAERLQEAGKDNYKVNSMLRSLKATFFYGINTLELSTKNPCLGLKFYPVKINLKYIPTDRDLGAIRELLTESQCFLVDFVEQTGCRINEAIRFKSEDIDGDLIILWTRKSKNSNLTPRRIPKPPCLIDYIGKGKVFDEWKTYPRFLDEKVEMACRHRWTFHNLRHRRASIWAQSGMTTFEIMSRLGHNNLSTTMRYLQLLGYTRL